MRSRERHQKPVACSSSLGGHFASCLKILFSSLVRKKEYLVYVSKFYDCNKNLERATQRKTDISGLIFHLNNIFSFIFHNNQFPFPPLLPSPPLSHALPSPWNPSLFSFRKKQGSHALVHMLTQDSAPPHKSGRGWGK